MYLMKSFKFSWLVALAMILGTASAFTTIQKSNKADEQIWYTYDSSKGGTTDANAYSPTPGDMQICNETQNICGVKALEDQSNLGHPDLTDPNKVFESQDQ